MAIFLLHSSELDQADHNFYVTIIVVHSIVTSSHKNRGILTIKYTHRDALEDIHNYQNQHTDFCQFIYFLFSKINISLTNLYDVYDNIFMKFIYRWMGKEQNFTFLTFYLDEDCNILCVHDCMYINYCVFSRMKIKCITAKWPPFNKIAFYYRYLKIIPCMHICITEIKQERMLKNWQLNLTKSNDTSKKI